MKNLNSNKNIIESIDLIISRHRNSLSNDDCNSLEAAKKKLHYIQQQENLASREEKREMATSIVFDLLKILLNPNTLNVFKDIIN